MVTATGDCGQQVGRVAQGRCTARYRPVTMRLASCNILHGVDVRRLSRDTTAVGPDDVDLHAVADWIGDLDADVVALQEVDHRLGRSGGVDQLRWLSDRLGYDGVFGAALHGNPDVTWEEVPEEGLPPDEPGYGVALLSRVGLRDVSSTRLPYGGPGTREPGASPTNPGMDREPRVALSATVGANLRVTTAHLSYMFWQAVPQLGRAMRAAANGAAAQQPGVLVGDLNLPLWGGWLALSARGLNPVSWPREATRSNGWRHLRGEATYPAWNPRVQLDQVYVRNIPGDVAVQVGPAGPSDHLPLIVDL